VTADRLVGRSVPRVDGRDKVTGAARFCGDLSFPGMLYARILRSPVVHGRIESVDSEAARRLPGVKLVLTGADLGAIDPYFGPAFKDRPILAIEKVRYEGEPVAAVVAEDRETAARALELIDVAYQELPAVTSVEQAVAPGAPLVHSWVEPAGHFATCRAPSSCRSATSAIASSSAAAGARPGSRTPMS
jgi:CO/xanthine dehydrogenase Mo-binding subunit